MIDPTQDTADVEAGTSAPIDNAVPAAMPNGAAASNPLTAPPVPIQPDDLHDLFAGAPSLEGDEEEDPLAQLRSDPNYAALIRDLEYIASQARLLFTPSEQTPSDDVWTKIQSQLPTKSDEA